MYQNTLVKLKKGPEYLFINLVHEVLESAKNIKYILTWLPTEQFIQIMLINSELVNK